MNCNNKDQHPERGLPQFHLWRMIASFLCVMVATCSISEAQSGRKQNQAEPKPASPNSSEPVKRGKKEQAPLAFVVVTSAPNYHQNHYQTVNHDVEYYARGGCLPELKKIQGAKVIEDEDVSRWEAREMARTEDQGWVIWMELKWGEGLSVNPASFRLRYLLFEARSGKTIASGYGNPNRQTWGQPQPPQAGIEEQARQAGRDIARQVMSELGISQ